MPKTVDIPRRTGTGTTTSTYNREYQMHEGGVYVEHEFSMGAAFKFGLGIGIGLIVAVPIGIVVAIFTIMVFGSALVGMLQGLT